MNHITTKERIIYEALNLFSERGYEAVSMIQIADSVGIKAPSLYNHYKSKRDIFNGILTEMENRYKSQVFSMQMNGINPEQDIELFHNISEDQLVEMGIGLFLYFLHDPYMSKFRKLLTMGQYQDPKLASLYADQYVDAPLTYQGQMFHLLTQIGVLKTENPQIMALHFYAPMYLLLISCESHPEKEEEILEMAKEHIKQFNRLYSK